MPTALVNTLEIKDSRIFAGTSGAGIYQSGDNGEHWSPRNNGLPDSCDVVSLLINGNDFYAGTGSGQVFISHDEGNHWQVLHNGIANSDICSMAFCETNFIAGTTGEGVKLFAGNGENGKWINQDLADTSVTSMILNNLNIFIGTYGSGVWKRAFSDLFKIGINPDTLVLQQFVWRFDSLFITSDLSWSIKGQAVSWLSYDKTEGNGNDTIVFHTTAPNDNPWSRYVTYLVTSDKTTTVPFIVEQLGKFAGTQNISHDQLSIFPNPTTGIISIKSHKTIENIAIMNSSGLIIREKEGGFTETVFDLSEEPDGIYYIRIDGNDWSDRFKVILVKK